MKRRPSNLTGRYLLQYRSWLPLWVIAKNSNCSNVRNPQAPRLSKCHESAAAGDKTVVKCAPIAKPNEDVGALSEMRVGSFRLSIHRPKNIRQARLSPKHPAEIRAKCPRP